MTLTRKEDEMKPRYPLHAALATVVLTGVAAAAVMGQFSGNAPPGTLPFGVYDPDGTFDNIKDVAIEHVFLPWEDVSLASLADADKYAQSHNRALLVTLEPWTWSRDDRNRPATLRKDIDAGRYDANMTSVCGALNDLKSPVTLRWGHEMDDNNGQFIWAGWKPDDYIRAYRRMITLCKDAAPSVKYIWSPLGDEGMQAYYPGNDYVDLVGLSVFGLQSWDQAKFNHDRSYEEILAPRYARAITFGKPVVVAELGYSGDATYVDTWENDVRDTEKLFPKLVGAVYFNYPEVYDWPVGFGRPDWRVDHRVTETTG